MGFGGYFSMKTMLKKYACLLLLGGLFAPTYKIKA